MILRQARFLANLTQTELSFLTGINQTKLSHIENGFRQPSHSELKKLAQALKISANKLDFPEPAIARNRVRVS